MCNVLNIFVGTFTVTNKICIIADYHSTSTWRSQIRYGVFFHSSFQANQITPDNLDLYTSFSFRSIFGIPFVMGKVRSDSGHFK